MEQENLTVCCLIHLELFHHRQQTSSYCREQKPGVFNKPGRVGQPSQDKNVPAATEKKTAPPDKTPALADKKAATPKDPFLAVLEKKAQAQEKAAAILASKKAPDKTAPAADKKALDRKPAAPDKKVVPADSKAAKAPPESKKAPPLQEKKGKPGVDAKTAGAKASLPREKKRGISELPMPPGYVLTQDVESIELEGKVTVVVMEM